ncbi:uncharacterized protein LOC117652649 [Thrips palmi]|uniref:Uncharacterized protein LOC117652649 n=1 Tax=Thrips palmi TaxID=161013 RepID=A0A6P9A6M7_THRPL|nr:uncharacterized protein LOC117652649 [Thrips palmi]XP_034253623.1 uncharacterized protein LOC117652649 [Thrips palmi]
MSLIMDGIPRPSTPIYLSAKAALIPKRCRFCHQLMEIKQINLTEAVRLCYKCSTPFRDLNSSDIEFYHRSYRDVHKNPKDWSLNVASEEEELHSMQSWMEQVSLAVSKYEDSSDDDAPSACNKNGSNGIQKDSLCQFDDLGLPDLVSELQQGANFSNAQSVWNNAAIDELDAALAKAAHEKADSASLPFSLDDLFLPECLPQNPDPQFDFVPPNESLVIERNVSIFERENIEDNVTHETDLVDPVDGLRDCERGEKEETEENTSRKAPEDLRDCDKHKGIRACENIIQQDSSLIERSDLTLGSSSPKQENISTKTLISEKSEENHSNTTKDQVKICKMMDMKSAVDEDKSICNRQADDNDFDEKCRGDSVLQEESVAAEERSSGVCGKEMDIDQNVDDVLKTPARDSDLNDDCLYIGKTPEKNSDLNDKCDYYCKTPSKDANLDDDCVNIFETPEKNTDGNLFCNTPIKNCNFRDDSFDSCQTLEKSTGFDRKLTDNNQQLSANDHNFAEFSTSTPQVVLREKKYRRSTMGLSCGHSVVLSLNSQNFVLPIETNILTLDSTGIFSAYPPDTLVSQFFCDCDDEILQLSPSTQEKEDHCVDFRLPELSVCSVMDKDVYDDREEDLRCFPSDLDKIIFSPKETSLKRDNFKPKLRSKMKPTKLLLDTSQPNMCEPPIIISEQSICQPNSILVTVPADHDITPEMLESSSLNGIPILFECLDSSVLHNNVNVAEVQDTHKEFESKLVVPMAVDDELETDFHSDNNNYNNQTPACQLEQNVTNINPVLVDDEAKTFVHCDTDEKQAPPIFEDVVVNAQDKAASADSSEQFSISYSICDSLGGFRIDVNRCDPNNIFRAEESFVNAEVTKDVSVLEPVQHSISNELCYKDHTENYSVERSDFLNNEAFCSRNEHGVPSKETNYCSTGKETKTVKQMVRGPLLCYERVEEEDDELRSFTGAKFSLLAKRKKGAKVTPDSKVVNLMQVVQNEVKRSNTPERERKKNSTIDDL